MSRSRKQNADKRPAIDKQAAFKEFKSLETESGADLEAKILASRNELKNARQEIRNKTEICNNIKSQIDFVKGELDTMTEKKKMDNINHGKNAGLGDGRADDFLEANQVEAEEIIDEQELLKLKHMKDLKRQYREAYQELKDLKSEA